LDTKIDQFMRKKTFDVQEIYYYADWWWYIWLPFIRWGFGQRISYI